MFHSPQGLGFLKLDSKTGARRSVSRRADNVTVYFEVTTNSASKWTR